MGTEIKCSEVMAEFGTTCSTCTPSLWESGKTPKYIFIVFAGVEACSGAPEPPNGYRFRLNQLPGTPCKWSSGWVTIEDRNWLAAWGVGGNDVFLQPQGLGLVFTFYDFNAGCDRTGENESTCPGGFGENGHYSVFWEQDDIPRTINCDFELNPISGTAFHRGHVDATHEVIRLNNRNGYTKCRVKVVTTEF